MEATTTHDLPSRYADAHLVARGGMGEVWKAIDTQLDRPVAVKLLRDGAGNEPPETLLERFKREARVIASLSSHRNIVTVFDVGETENGTPFMTMQWLGGGTLPVDREHGTWGDRKALTWLGQTASGLDAAHRANIVHRDVKPGNILLDDEGVAHVGDFGIAQLQDGLAAGLTQTGALVGTASYMSPEQATGHPAEPASDQYALAAIAFEMLVGLRPFQREGAVAELAAHVSEPPPIPSEHRSDLPQAVDRVFARALAKEPGDRFPTCGAFVEALDAAMSQEASTVISNTTVLPVVTQRTVSAPRPVTSRPFTDDDTFDQPRRGSSATGRRIAAGVAALCLVGALGGLAVAVVDDDGASNEQTAERSATDVRATTKEPAPEAAAPKAVAPPAEAPADPAAEPGVPGGKEEKEPEKADDKKQDKAAEKEAEREAERAAEPKDTNAAIQQHERSYQLLQQGQYEQALAEGSAALGKLGGVAPYEAYANYNVGASLAGLGRCSEALPYLDRSEQLQGTRSEITAVRQRCANGGAQ